MVGFGSRQRTMSLIREFEGMLFIDHNSLAICAVRALSKDKPFAGNRIDGLFAGKGQERAVRTLAVRSEGQCRNIEGVQ